MDVGAAILPSLAKAARLNFNRINESRLVYNQAEAYMTDLLICRPELADKVLVMAVA